MGGETKKGANPMELRIFSTRKEILDDLTEKEKAKSNAAVSSETENNANSKSEDASGAKSDKKRPQLVPKVRTRSPTKLIQRFLSPTKSLLNHSSKKAKSPQTSIEAESASPAEDKRDRQPAPAMDREPEEVREEAEAAQSETDTSQTLVMKKKPIHEICTIHVAPSQMKKQTLRKNEFVFPTDKTNNCAHAEVALHTQASEPQFQTPATSPNPSHSRKSTEPVRCDSAEPFPTSHTPSRSSRSSRSSQSRLSSVSPLPTGLAKFPTATDVPASTAQFEPVETNVEDLVEKSTKLDKWSKSFLDLTIGSQDRLNRWKDKLKEFTRQRSPRKGESVHISGLGECVCTLPRSAMHSIPPPRPLHSTKSCNGDLCQFAEVKRTVPQLHKSRSVKDAGPAMEHRTLKSRATPDYLTAQHMRSLHELVQSIEGFGVESERTVRKPFPHAMTASVMSGCSSSERLPPPARITPFSGVKPQDYGIVRPIAFRPLASSVKGPEAGSSHSPDVCHNQPGNFISNLRQISKEHSRSIGNLHSTVISADRSQNTMIQPSTSGQLFGGKSIGSLVAAEENDYDTVSDYLDRKDENHPQFGFNTVGQHGPRSRSHAGRRSHTISQFNANAHSTGSMSSQLTGSSTSSTSATNSPLQNGVKKSSSGSRQPTSRNSNGLHVTPSPSDSGIVDYETLIRDKENELSNVRQAMEQNEEVLIRVYQDKERQYKEQVSELRQKLNLAQQSEQLLRQQLRQSDEHRQFLQKSVQQLGEDKLALQRKCGQMERDLAQLRNRVGLQGSLGQPASPTKLLATPRLHRTDSQDTELRIEVEGLRDELSKLRSQFNQQVQVFSDERVKWQADQNGNTKKSFGMKEPLTKHIISGDRLI